MKKLMLLCLLATLTLTSCNNDNSLTGEVYEVGTSSVDGITFFAIECDDEKVGFFLNERYDNDTLILSRVKVEYDPTSKAELLDSNMDEIITYTAENITVLKVYESNFS